MTTSSASGGSGFAIMAIIVAAERGWIRRGEAVDRLSLILGFLERATMLPWPISALHERPHRRGDPVWTQG